MLSITARGHPCATPAVCEDGEPVFGIDPKSFSAKGHNDTAGHRFRLFGGDHGMAGLAESHGMAEGVGHGQASRNKANVFLRYSKKPAYSGM